VVTGRWTGRGLFDQTRPVSVQHLRVSLVFYRMRWRVRSRTTRRVRSLGELIGLQLDDGTMASGQFSSASGR
jgi:hypothetical protein